VRIEDLNQTIRERADNALATYLSSVANRQNETMRGLIHRGHHLHAADAPGRHLRHELRLHAGLQWRVGLFTVLGNILLAIINRHLAVLGQRLVYPGPAHAAWTKPFVSSGNKIRGYIVPVMKQNSPK
jgi:hypothetical protein